MQYIIARRIKYKNGSYTRWSALTTIRDNEQEALAKRDELASSKVYEYKVLRVTDMPVEQQPVARSILHIYNEYKPMMAGFDAFRKQYPEGECLHGALRVLVGDEMHTFRYCASSRYIHRFHGQSFHEVQMHPNEDVFSDNIRDYCKVMTRDRSVRT